MATLDRLNPEHEEYLLMVKEDLNSRGYDLQDWGIEHTSGYSHKNLDWSIESLKQRARYDLRISFGDFICEADIKTTALRIDTGNIAIEIWPVIFSKGKAIPQMLIFKDLNGGSLWVNELPARFMKSYIMPDRLPDNTKSLFRRYIYQCLGYSPYETTISWNNHNSSGDPFFLWNIGSLKRVTFNYNLLLESKRNNAIPGQQVLL